MVPSSNCRRYAQPRNTAFCARSPTRRAVTVFALVSSCVWNGAWLAGGCSHGISEQPKNPCWWGFVPSLWLLSLQLSSETDLGVGNLWLYCVPWYLPCCCTSVLQLFSFPVAPPAAFFLSFPFQSRLLTCCLIVATTYGVTCVTLLNISSRVRATM